MEELLPSFVDEFRVIRELSFGAYFTSYVAEDLSRGRIVILKIARPVDDESRSIIDAHKSLWFALRQRALNINPEIYKIGERNGRLYMAAKWVADVPLSSIKVQDLEAIPITRALYSCLSMLHLLHQQGFIHGDANPRNIIIAAGNVAHLVDPGPPIQRLRRPLPDHLWGALTEYTAPEVLAGELYTPAADVFSLGAIIMKLADKVGEPPPAVAKIMTSFLVKDRPSSAEALRLFPVQPPASFMRLERPKDARSRIFRSLDDLSSPDRTALSPAPPFRLSGLPNIGRATVRELLNRDIAQVVPEASQLRVVRPDLALETSSSTMGIADVSIFAPNQVSAASTFFIEVWIGRKEDRAKLLEQATSQHRLVERGLRSDLGIKRDALISIVLRLPDFEIPEPVELLGWNGGINNAGFVVKAPASLAPGRYSGSAKLIQRQVPFASILFHLEVRQPTGVNEPGKGFLPVNVTRPNRVFGSYASLDRLEVLRRAQGIRAAGTEIFLDIVGLRTGSDWATALFREIAASDGMFLFWSRAAARSEWVEREWRFALETRGIDFITPVPLDDPRQVSAPVELQGKHFNDMILAFIKAEEHLAGD